MTGTLKSHATNTKSHALAKIKLLLNDEEPLHMKFIQPAFTYKVKQKY